MPFRDAPAIAVPFDASGTGWTASMSSNETRRAHAPTADIVPKPAPARLPDAIRRVTGTVEGPGNHAGGPL